MIGFQNDEKNGREPQISCKEIENLSKASLLVKNSSMVSFPSSKKQIFIDRPVLEDHQQTKLVVPLLTKKNVSKLGEKPASTKIKLKEKNHKDRNGPDEFSTVRDLKGKAG